MRAWRAAHQAIIHDEAFSFLYFIDGPWSSLGSPYQAANHVLYSFLAKLSVALFGLSELSLRLPSLLVDLLHVGSVPRARKLRVAPDPMDRLPGDWIAPAPDGLSIAARGYGLGIALLVWAIYASLHGRPTRSGLLLGFGIAASLTDRLPGYRTDRRAFAAGEKGPDQRHRCHGRRGDCSCHGHLLLSLSHGHSGKLLCGEHSLQASLFTLIIPSVRASQRAGLFGTTKAALFIEIWIVPAIALFWILIWVREWQKAHVPGS